MSNNPLFKPSPVPSWQKPGPQGGRPGLDLRELRKLARQYAPEALEKLLHIMHGSRSDRVAKDAAVELLTWAYGKPSTWVEDATGIPADISTLPRAEQLRLIKERMVAYGQAAAVLEQATGTLYEPGDEDVS